MPDKKTSWIRFSVGWILCFLVRLLPFRPPNIEPVLAFQMPFAKNFGYLPGFVFAFFNIILYDLLTAGLGPWTFITAVAYGLIGIWAARFFRRRTGTRIQYASFAIWSTLFYDAATGLTLGPIFFGQSFLAALVGQVPFTALHLLGNVGFALILSPLVDKWLSAPEFSPKLWINHLPGRAPESTIR